MKEKNKKYFRAFTLVELIIVITILAILATISFASFSWYTKNSNDANRVSTIWNVKKAMSLFFTQTWKYPIPESVYLTWSFNGTTLTQVWYVKENITRLLSLSKTPLDPQWNNYYVYATSVNNKHYQIWTILEWNQQLSQLVEKTYANTYKAYVTGDYNGILNYNWYLYNLPSLIITGTGNLNVTSYIINNWKNLPYSLNGETLNNSQTVSEVLNQLTWTSTTLTWILLPTNKDTYMSNSWTYKTALWYDGDMIWNSIFWSQYFVWGNATAINGWWSSSGGWFTWWRLIDSNCMNDDFVFTQSWITYRWAWCNSTLWNGFEWWQLNSNIWTSSYSWNLLTCFQWHHLESNTWSCVFWSALMLSNANPKTWFTWVNHHWDSTYNTIWGKFYQWSNAASACPSGWVIPTDDQWTLLENYLNGSVCRTGDEWMCTNLWWRNNWADTRKLVDALKIPLSWLRNHLATDFSARWSYSVLWSSTQVWWNVYARSFDSQQTWVRRVLNNPVFGFNARCLKVD